MRLRITSGSRDVLMTEVATSQLGEARSGGADPDCLHQNHIFRIRRTASYSSQRFSPVVDRHRERYFNRVASELLTCFDEQDKARLPLPSPTTLTNKERSSPS